MTSYVNRLLLRASFGIVTFKCRYCQQETPGYGKEGLSLMGLDMTAKKQGQSLARDVLLTVKHTWATEGATGTS